MDYIPIPILGKDHLLYVAILLFFALLLFFNPKQIKQHHRRITLIILGINLLQQGLLYGYFIYFDMFTVAESLPLHLSRITSILGIMFMMTQNRKIFPLIAYFSLFAWLSFLVPTDIQPITHPLGVSFLVNHVITLLFPFYIIIAYQLSLVPKDKYIAYGWFLLYVISVYFLNPMLQGNYFYLVDKPIFNSMPDSLYLIAVCLVTFLLFSLGGQLFKRVAKHYHS